MNIKKDIKRIEDFYQVRKIDLPECAGVYAFWWLGEKKEIINSDRKIILSGPSKKPIKVTFEDRWPKELKYPCLYIGKSTNIRERFSRHIRGNSPGRDHGEIDEYGTKKKLKTTTCQLRYGIEHIFRSDKNPLKIIRNKVGFSYQEFPGDDPTKRFYEENLLIGKWKPWFNLDSER